MARFLLTLGVMALALVLVSANTPTESAHIATTVPTHPMAKGADVTDHSVNATHLSDHGGGGHGGKLERYPVAVIDFERVQTPFIIGLWIFCACLGKIGTSCSFCAGGGIAEAVIARLRGSQKEKTNGSFEGILEIYV